MKHFIGRICVAAAIAASLGAFHLATAYAEDKQWRHGLSLFGDIKYPADFKQFGYVNANAPKGGRLRIAATGSFDSLNPFIIKGRPAALSAMIYDSLMTSAADEPATEYGLLAEAVSHPADYSSVTYRLRAEARWHDGKPVTPEDVVFSLDMLKANHPRYGYYYKNVTKAEKTGEREVTFTFDQKGNRELPQITGQLQIVPKHYWQGTDASGKKRDITETTLTPPLGSGPYRIKEVAAGRYVVAERVADYWGKDLPVNVGRYNFDEIRADYYRDTNISFEAFKADEFDVWFENRAQRWATGYDIASVKSGAIIKEVFKTKNAQSMQAFVFNTRKARFADPKVRLALNYAFDFEWANKNLFYGQYTRVNSYFSNSELAATGLPEGKELEILNTIKDQVPPEVFTTVYKNPVSADARASRANLRQARKLLAEAGWTVKGGKLVNAKTGEQMTMEFLLVSPAFERVVNPYVKRLERLGIRAVPRIVDTAQYQNRLDNFDFDVIVGGWGQSLSPGNEQRNYWGSAAAGRKGSRNYVGINDPAIDKLIDRIIFAKDRAELVAATRALDRVLLWNHFVVPQWYFAGSRVARWDRFGIPEKRPDFGIGYPDTWWYDAERAKALEAAKP